MVLNVQKIIKTHTTHAIAHVSKLTGHITPRENPQVNDRLGDHAVYMYRFMYRPDGDAETEGGCAGGTGNMGNLCSLSSILL